MAKKITQEEYNEEAQRIIDNCDGSCKSDLYLVQLKAYYEKNKEVTQ